MRRPQRHDSCLPLEAKCPACGGQPWSRRGYSGPAA